MTRREREVFKQLDAWACITFFFFSPQALMRSIRPEMHWVFDFAYLGLVHERGRATSHTSSVLGKVASRTTTTTTTSTTTFVCS